MKKKIFIISWLAVLLLLAVACGGQTDEAEPMSDASESDTLQVTDVTANMSLPSTTGAVYMLIANNSNTDDALVGATIPGCGVVELHEMAMDGDVMVMRQVEGGRIPVPAGETVTLKRGGLHVMCIEKAEPIEVGQMIPVTLEFENAGTMEVQAMTIDISADGMEMDMDMHEEGDGGMDMDSEMDMEGMPTSEP
ncbi:MAG: copper chaperone PCu(A)C [Candidatus Promineifilaceae bacterium]